MVPCLHRLGTRLLAHSLLVISAAFLASCGGNSQSAAGGPAFALLIPGGGGTSVDPSLIGVASVNVTNANLNFGAVAIGTTATRTVTITNIGRGELNLTTVTVTGAAFAVTQPPQLVLARGATTTFQVSFSPTEPIAYTGGRVYVNVVSPDVGTSFGLNGVGTDGTIGPPVTPSTTSVQILDVSGRDLNGGAPIYDFGVIIPPSSTQATFRARNNGMVPLTFKFEPGIQLTQDPVTGGWALTGSPAAGTVILPGDEVPFTVTYTPSTVNRVSANVSMPFLELGTAFMTLAAGLRDELYIFGNAIPILNGDDSPEARDFTDFGELEVRTTDSATRPFVIFNNRDIPITVSAINIIGDTATGAQWALVDMPLLPFTLSGKSGLNFAVRYTARQVGLSKVRVQVLSTDVASPDYRYAVQAFGSGPGIRIDAVVEREVFDDATARYVYVETGLQEIADNTLGDDVPVNSATASDNTDFGLRPIKVVKRHRFRITNTGNRALDLRADPVVNVLGRDPDMFTLVVPPAPSIQPGASSEFVIEFTALERRSWNPLSDPGDDSVELPLAGNRFAPISEIGLAGETRMYMKGIIRLDTNTPDPRHQPYWFNIAGTRYRTALTFQAAPGNTNPADEYRTPGASGTDNRTLGLTAPHLAYTTMQSNQTNFGDVLVNGFRDRSYILRNDSTWPVRLGGAPLINIYGANLGDYRVTINGVRSSTGDLLLDAGQVATAVADGTGVTLAPESYVDFTVRFSPTDIGSRSARLEIINDDSANDPAGASATASVVPRYIVFLEGIGAGPKIRLTDINGVEIARGDQTPSSADSTEFGSPVYICNSQDPSGTSATFIITNIGNRSLILGEGLSNAVDDQLDFAGDFSITQPTDDVLDPGESGQFRVVFSPNPLSPTLELRTHAGSGGLRGQQAEESARTVVIRINSNDPFGSDVPDDDNDPDPGVFTFTMRGTAIDPKMEVLGKGIRIYDSDYSPRDADNTVFNQVDMFGGILQRDFEVVNSGTKYPLLMGAIAQPYIDNQEVILPIPVDSITSSGDGAVLSLPGYLYDDDVIDATCRNLKYYYQAQDASVLHRLRDGDTVYVGGVQATIVDITPDLNDLLDEIGALGSNNVRPDNLAPPEEHGNQHFPQGDPELISQRWPLGFAMHLPARGRITVRSTNGLPIPSSTAAANDTLYAIDSNVNFNETAALDGLDYVDVGVDFFNRLVINPAFTGEGPARGDYITLQSSNGGNIGRFLCLSGVTQVGPNKRLWVYSGEADLTPPTATGVSLGQYNEMWPNLPDPELVPCTPDNVTSTIVNYTLIDSQTIEVQLPNTNDGNRLWARINTGTVIAWGNGGLGSDTVFTVVGKRTPRWIRLEYLSGDDIATLIGANLLDDIFTAQLQVFTLTGLFREIEGDASDPLAPSRWAFQFATGGRWSNIASLLKLRCKIKLDMGNTGGDDFDYQYSITEIDIDRGLIYVSEDLTALNTDGGPNNSSPINGKTVIQEIIEQNPPTNHRMVIVLPFLMTVQRSSTIRVVKNDFEITTSLPASLNPGEKAVFNMSFRPRWSTGHDRNRTPNTFPPYPPKDPRSYHIDEFPGTPGVDWITLVRGRGPWESGWDSLDIALSRANGDADLRHSEYSDLFVENTAKSLGMPQGNLEHIVEVSIPNSDVDTQYNFKTGVIDRTTYPGYLLDPPPSVYYAGDYIDQTVPMYEFALLGVSRAPRIQVSAADIPNTANSTEYHLIGSVAPYRSWHYSVFAPSGAKLGISTSLGFPSTNISTGTSNNEIWRDIYIRQQSQDNLMVSGVGDMTTPYLPSGRLTLASGTTNAFRISGTNADDFRMEVMEDIPSRVIPLLPMSVDRVSNAYIRVRVYFKPRSLGSKSAVLSIPSNDANGDVFALILTGIGAQPPGGIN